MRRCLRRSEGLECRFLLKQALELTQAAWSFIQSGPKSLRSESFMSLATSGHQTGGELQRQRQMAQTGSSLSPWPSSVGQKGQTSLHLLCHPGGLSTQFSSRYLTSPVRSWER